MPQFWPKLQTFAIVFAVRTANSNWGVCGKHCHTQILMNVDGNCCAAPVWQDKAGSLYFLAGGRAQVLRRTHHLQACQACFTDTCGDLSDPSTAHNLYLDVKLAGKRQGFLLPASCFPTAGCIQWAASCHVRNAGLFKGPGNCK